MIDSTGSIDEAGILVTLAATGAAIKKYGPVALKLFSKLLTSSTVVDLVKTQGTETALAKLETPTDIFCVLESFELNADGKIVLKGQGRVNTLLHLERPLTESEMEECIKAMRAIFSTCRREE